MQCHFPMAVVLFKVFMISKILLLKKSFYKFYNVYGNAFFVRGEGMWRGNKRRPFATGQRTGQNIVF